MTDFNTHPQPRTFAPSKEDVLQSERRAQAAHALLACSRPPRCARTDLQYFFGAPVSPEKLKVRPTHPCARARQMLTHTLLAHRTTRSTTP
jgi:hypothetical protein